MLGQLRQRRSADFATSLDGLRKPRALSQTAGRVEGECRPVPCEGRARGNTAAERVAPKGPATAGLEDRTP